MYNTKAVLALIAIISSAVVGCNNPDMESSGVENDHKIAVKAQEDYSVIYMAGGNSINPCLKKDILTGILVQVTASQDNTVGMLNKSNVLAHLSDGNMMSPIGVLPLDYQSVEHKQIGSMLVCGGSGGIKIPGNERELGFIGQNTLIFAGDSDSAGLKFSFMQGQSIKQYFSQ